MHTLYLWEFDKIKKNLLTPLNAMSEEEMMPSAWILISPSTEPSKAVLAVNNKGDYLIGYVVFNNVTKRWECHCDDSMMLNVVAFMYLESIPAPPITEK